MLTKNALNFKFLITGGSGFIGSALIRHIIQNTKYSVFNLDKLTYASNQRNLAMVSDSPRYKFIKGDIKNIELVKEILFTFKPDKIINLAAESHVDRSITNPDNFIQTNIIGTYNLLECVRDFWENYSFKNEDFYFHHVSTDEVFGSLKEKGLFTEESPYRPNSPYSASKASSDHLVRAWNKTYGIPTIISNCSNNYGPYQYPEKLIPLTISCALQLKPIPVYGNGLQIRDWLYVDDHAKALLKIALKGEIGETYNIGARSEKNNLEVVNKICEILDKKLGAKLNNKNPYNDLITFVKDRPGHDQRYGIDPSKSIKRLKWSPIVDFNFGMEETIKWYLKNVDWLNLPEKFNMELFQ